MPATTGPAGYASVNPFVITSDVESVTTFVREVFGARERPGTRTMDDDGLLLHLELAVGDSTIAVAERKPGWPTTPSLLQVWVDDMAASLAAAARLGADAVTRPTPFFGDTMARVVDAAHNLWWLYQRGEAEPDWTSDVASDAASDWADDEAEADELSWAPTPDLVYLHDTLLEAMRRL
jgi:uncharacterized glyoxalase superfamily protein PhnB